MTAETNHSLWQITFTCINADEQGCELIALGASGTEIISPTRLRCFFKGPSSELEQFILSASELGLTCDDRKQIAERNWTAECKELWQTIKVGALEIVPVIEGQIEPEPAPGRIRIVPGCGFGTGHHTSTQFILEFLQTELVKRAAHSTVLDVGTGSGILAIACCALYGSKVVAIDNDSLALDNAACNLRLNSPCASMIALQLSSIEQVTGTYDLITANIYAEVLAQWEQHFAAHLNKDGLLLLSGIARDLAPYVDLSYRASAWRQEGHLEREGWTGRLLRKI